ncbi:MAG TPA: PAS domain-containing protein [Pyrinomonadaceae bacterium]|nr:PAS domain-containing protein [Pyrinomonadaceae bacterium]
MNTSHTNHAKLPFGLLELDAAGEVIRYSPAAEERSDVQAADILGRQFFKEVVRDKKVKDFEARFQLFMKQGQTVDRFSASFPSEAGEVSVQFLLARLNKKVSRSEHLALVRIMPAA